VIITVIAQFSRIKMHTLKVLDKMSFIYQSPLFSINEDLKKIFRLTQMNCSNFRWEQ